MAKAKKLPSGNWRVQAYKNGITKSFTGENKKQVEIEALTWQNDNDVSDKNINLAEAYSRYISSKEKVLSPTTVRLYKQMQRTTMQGLMQYNLDEITNEKIQKEINIYSVGRSPKAVKNAYGLFTAVFKMFLPEKRFLVKLPQKTKTEIYIPTDEDIKTLTKSANGDLKTAIMLGAFAGLRRGEICALTKQDISDSVISITKSLAITEAGVYVEKQPKSYAGIRKVDIPKFLYDDLMSIKTDKIITLMPSTIGNQFRKLLRENNIPHFRFHDLRHYYVSRCFDLGLPEKYIISQVGHSSSAITKAVYDHISKQKQSEYSKVIAESFANIM